MEARGYAILFFESLLVQKKNGFTVAEASVAPPARTYDKKQNKTNAACDTSATRYRNVVIKRRLTSVIKRVFPPALA